MNLKRTILGISISLMLSSGFLMSIDTAEATGYGYGYNSGYSGNNGFNNFNNGPSYGNNGFNNFNNGPSYYPGPNRNHNYGYGRNGYGYSYQDDPSVQQFNRGSNGRSLQNRFGGNDVKRFRSHRNSYEYQSGHNIPLINGLDAVYTNSYH